MSQFSPDGDYNWEKDEPTHYKILQDTNNPPPCMKKQSVKYSEVTCPECIETIQKGTIKT